MTPTLTTYKNKKTRIYIIPRMIHFYSKRKILKEIKKIRLLYVCILLLIAICAIRSMRILRQKGIHDIVELKINPPSAIFDKYFICIQFIEHVNTYSSKYQHADKHEEEKLLLTGVFHNIPVSPYINKGIFKQPVKLD